jgi:hypothetical protein
MPKIRSVVVWTVAALVTAGMEIVGLQRAIAIRKQNDAEASCPVPAAVVETPVAPAICEPPRPDVQIRVLSVRDDAVEIEAGGKRHELPGYPPPISKNHGQGVLTTAVVSLDGALVAVAGECSGPEDGPKPSCVPVFVRLYRVGDGAPAGDLKMRWDSDNYKRRALAMAFDHRAERLAVLVRTSWSDCMWDGDNVELFVYRLADGARVARRLIARDTADLHDVHSLRFHDDQVHVLTTRAHARPKTRVVRLRTPGAA